MTNKQINRDKRIIGAIGNYYGGLFISQSGGKYYWIIEDHNTDFDEIDEWEEISQELYIQLLKHNTP